MSKTSPGLIIIDGHEDIAFNVMLGRDFLRSADETRALEKQPNPELGIATLGLPDLFEANVRIVFSTLWVGPCEARREAYMPCYNTPDESCNSKAAVGLLP